MTPKSRRRRSTEPRHLRSLLEIAPDAMLVMDQAGVIVLVNPQTERLFGYQQEDILGRPVEVLIPEPFRERHRGHRTNFFSDPRPMGVRLQLFGLRKDGTEFPVEISLSPVETAEGTVVTSAIRDITERTLAEESRLRLAILLSRLTTRSFPRLSTQLSRVGMPVRSESSGTRRLKRLDSQLPFSSRLN